MKLLPNNSDVIYDLKPRTFEQMVAQLLQAEGYHLSDNITLPPVVDFLATKDEKTFAVLVKHRQTLSADEVGEFFNRRSLLEINVPQELIFVTSARLQQSQVQRMQITNLGYALQIISHDDLMQLIAKHGEVAKRFLRPIRWERSLRRISLVLSIVCFAVGISGGVLVKKFSAKTGNQLDERIQTVESALSNLRDLESSLNKVKDDMVATEHATVEANKKYEQAQEMLKLTEPQVNALKQTLQPAVKWWYKPFDYLMGFLIGVASSIVAALLIIRWQRKTELSKPL